MRPASPDGAPSVSAGGIPAARELAQTRTQTGERADSRRSAPATAGPRRAVTKKRDVVNKRGPPAPSQTIKRDDVNGFWRPMRKMRSQHRVLWSRGGVLAPFCSQHRVFWSSVRGPRGGRAFRPGAQKRLALLTARKWAPPCGMSRGEARRGESRWGHHAD